MSITTEGSLGPIYSKSLFPPLEPGENTFYLYRFTCYRHFIYVVSPVWLLSLSRILLRSITPVSFLGIFPWHKRLLSKYLTFTLMSKKSQPLIHMNRSLTAEFASTRNQPETFSLSRSYAFMVKKKKRQNKTLVNSTASTRIWAAAVA